MSNEVSCPDPSSLGHLPRVKHTLRLFEHDGGLVLDISDETGGLGLQIYLAPIVASKLGQSLTDKARALVAKEAGNPERTATFETTNTVDYNAYVQPTQLQPDRKVSRRPRKPGRLRKNFR